MQLSSPDPESTTSGGRVLVVDDETELTAALCEMLGKHGIEAVGFTDGGKALAELKEQVYDVLLVDLMMPGMDGISLMKAALQIDPQMVVMIMTGQGTVQTAVEAMKNGAFDYILKPFKLNTVIASLSRALEIRQLRMENIQLRETVGIYELGQTVAFTLDLDLILDETIEAARQQCEADEVSILLPDTGGFLLASASGDGRERLIGEHVPAGEGTIAGWVARNQKTLVLQGEVHDERFAPTHPRPEIRAGISIPMVAGNELVGVLNVNITRRRHPVTQGQIRALRILVGIAASAIENARLHEQTERRLQRLTALRTIDLAITSSLDLRVTFNVLLDQVSSQLEVDAASIFLLDPQSQALEFSAGRGFHSEAVPHLRLLMGEGYAGTAALERRTVVVQDLVTARQGPDRDLFYSSEGIRSATFTPMITKGNVIGVLGVYRRGTFEPDQEWMEYVEALAGQGAIAIEVGRLFDNLQRSNQKLTLAYNATIEGWSRALDLRDRETEGHTRRVTEMTLRLARSIGWFDDDEIVQIHRGALLHDIGKMGVPDNILLKQGELTEEETAIIRQHPEIAYKLLYPIAFLRKALDIPYCHHEWWDGTGYPRGLSDIQIPLSARIFSVVDVWDALRSDRPYRPGLPDEEVIEYLRSHSGTQFDPQVVDAFIRLLEEEDHR